MTTTKSGICKNRSWGLVYENNKNLTGEQIVEHLGKQKYGLYAAAVYKHTNKNDELDYHYHVAAIFRDKPQIPYKDLPNYFAIDGKYVRNTPLKCKARNLDKKLLMHHNYCISEEKHPGETVEMLYAHKWTPPDTTEDGKDVAKLSTKEWVQLNIEEGKDFKWLFENGDLKRRADLMIDMDKYKKQLCNYKRFTESAVVIQPIDTFKPEVVDYVKKNWKEGTSLVLSGKSGMGKTELAKSLMTELHGSPKFISNINALAHRDPSQPIIFDDMDFSQCNRVKKIHMLDLANDRNIRILYGIATIEAGTQRIFTTNADTEAGIFGLTDMAHHRRMSFVNIDEFGKLYLEPSLDMSD